MKALNISRATAGRRLSRLTSQWIINANWGKEKQLDIAT